MSRREREPDPYWQEDVAIGEGRFFRGDTATIGMRLHTTTERFSRRQEIIPLAHPSGERTYVHGKPYLLVPDLTLTVVLTPEPEPSGPIGTVTGSEWTGMRHEDIGQAQAWYYPTDQLLVLWECFTEPRYRTSEDPRADTTLVALWAGFESWLTGRFPDARQLVTTWEDLYDRPQWQQFLATQDYTPIAPAAFGKDLTPSPNNALSRP
jgi:hypothetical protein